MADARLAPTLPRGELDAETAALQIRWFGLLAGYLYVNVAAGGPHRPVLNALLALGAVFTVLDTYYCWRGRVFLHTHPLVISFMEALFIGLLCFFDAGLDSPFRYYYLLSLICCAIRHTGRVTYVTCALDCVSWAALFAALPPDRQEPNAFVLTVGVLVWATWAANSMSRWLKHAREQLGTLNAALQENQSLLEARIADRTRELQEAQAHVLHQEKMAAFGLLAAGIAHEVGNPLTSISSIVQLLQKHDCDAYTRERLGLVGGQLQRIHMTLRELVNFSRPASTEVTRVGLAEALHEALNIAKYYKGSSGRQITAAVPDDLPGLHGVRDQFVQVFLNLILNAIDATGKGGRIDITATRDGEGVVVRVKDDGAGIRPESAARLFQPYFTTKKHGTGLGLFVTRRLVQQHGGRVEFTSAPGTGTEFRVHLPADRSSLVGPPT
jgi:signal transduction histidine kinase